MKKFRVTINEVLDVTYAIEAETAEAAERIATERWLDRSADGISDGPNVTEREACAEEDEPAPAFDACAFCMDFEAGELDGDQIIEGFQHLIDSGLAWQLQGSYGRAAARLIEAGHCRPAGAR